MRRSFSILLLTLFSILALTGQGVYYQTLGNRQGLYQSSAVSFWQDPVGRMWIGNDALNCYDGEEVRVFRVSEHLSGIEDSNVHALCGDDSILFFLVENSLIYFDLNQETFFNTGIETRSICKANHNLYYVSAEGVFCMYERHSNTSIPIIALPNNIKFSYSIIQASNGDFWLGTATGIYIINEERKEIVHHLLPEEYIVNIYLDSFETTWIVTQNHKIFLHTPEGDLSPIHIKGLQMGASGQYFSNSIFCIQEDIKGTIWIGTLTGIYKLSRDTGTPHFILEEHVLSESTIYALYSDRQGTIWIGSYYGDVRYYNPLTDNYTYHATDESNPFDLHGALIGQITKDKYENMYFATEGSGINILRPGSSTFEHLTTANGLPQNKIRALWYDEEYDRLFISAYMDGLCYYEPKTKQIHKVRYGVLETIHQRIIESMFPYKNDLILHTQNGLFKLDRSTLEISWFFPEGTLRDQSSGIVRTVYIDKKETMWVSSFRHGLFTIDLKSEKVPNHYGDGITEGSKIPSSIIKIKEDNQGELYFVTLKSGLLKYDAAPDTFVVFNEEKGILSNICYSLAFSPTNKLIATCNKGVMVLDIAPNNTILSLHTIRINPSSPLTAFIGDCGIYVSQEKDRIYVGSLYGLLTFSEKDLPIDHNLYSLYFSSLNINNQHISPASPLLGKAFYKMEKLLLPHNKNTLSIKFASSNYLSSRTSRYEYKLEGLEEFWTEINHKTITYNSLRPGNYKLIVREVVNKEKKAEIPITIKSPLWATVPAILCYILLLLLITAWVIRSYKSKTLLQASLEMERREIARIEETNRNKMDFFVNISNEFRTPLTLILSLIDRLPQDLPSGGKSKIEKIKRQASHLQELITEMIDFRKMEQNKLSLKIGNYDLISFLQEIYTTFSDYASERQISFKFNHSQEAIPVWFDKRQMQKVFYNLLSFILKFASSKDSITLSIHKVTGYHKIQITHKGLAPKSKDRNKLLDLLAGTSTLPDMSSLPDGAIGLAFSTGILQLHQAKMSVATEPDKTMLALSLPLGMSHYMEDIQEQENEIELPQPVIINKLTTNDPIWQEEIEQSEKKSYRMLLIEDDFEIRHMLKETFSMLYEVIEFDDATVGYEYAVKELPDIIISEIHLPGLSGIEMCSMLKTNINTFQIPVILLSSQPSEQQNVESIRSGAEYYFVKPFNIRILFLRCNYLVKNRRMMLENAEKEAPSEMFEMATNKKEQEFLAAANRIVEENWHNPGFDTKVWHEQLGMGRTRFFNQIKEVTGMTPNDYLLSLKMNRGRQLLDEMNSFTIAEIAYQLGFTSPAYFSKCFKKQFGITPQEYKRNLICRKTI